MTRGRQKTAETILQYEVERHGDTWRVRALSQPGRPLTGRTIGVDMTEDEACACRDVLNALARRNARHGGTP